MDKQRDTSVWPFIVPFLAFMVIGLLEPRFAPAESDPPAVAGTPGESGVSSAERDANDEYFRNQQLATANRYCLVYVFKVVVTCAVLIWYRKIYLRHFPLAATGWSLVTGAIGVVIWVGLCQLQIESLVGGWLGVDAGAARVQFNPFEQLPSQATLAGFLALRFAGLVVMVPICEELFLRGFLMRYVQSPAWWTVSLARLGTRAMLVAPLYGALTHPGEAIAAIVWFSLVTWLVRKTGKFWDAVIAHAITNGLLGLYVCLFSQWQLW